MSALDPDARGDGTPSGGTESPGEPQGKRGHGHWMMIACCVPMLVIAVALVATGVVGSGFIVAAIACTAMMAVMMIGMGGMGGRG